MRSSRAAESGAAPIVWGSWLVLMAAANVATPLYAVYADRFGFSSLVLTTIFATYAVVLVPALVLCGRLSDRFGRRPVMLAGVLVGAAGLALFALAQATAWLYAARAVQGLSVALISGAATAALVELDPDGDRLRAAVRAGLAQAGGSAAGPLVGGVVAQWAPWQLRLPYVVGLVAAAAAAVAVLRLPDTRDGEPEPWRVERPRVPREIRAAFFRVGLTAGLVWATMALFLSIVPSYVAALLHTGNLALRGGVGALALAASFAAHLLARRRAGPGGRTAALGLGLLSLGLLALAVAGAVHSLVLILGAALVAGAGHGIAFVAAQEELNDVAPPERRGEVTAAFIACIYFVVALAVISSGLLDLAFSLTASVYAVAIALVAAAAATGVWQLRSPA